MKALRVSCKNILKFSQNFNSNRTQYHQRLLYSTSNNSSSDTSKKNDNKVKKESCEGKNLIMNEMVQFGQPTYWTHPHLFDVSNDSQNEQVTPGISKNEYQNRREMYVRFLTNYQNHYFTNVRKESLYQGLIKNNNFIAIIPSCQVSFMAPDVPHTFKQNTDFVYLTGFKEPNSCLVLSRTDASTSFKTALFVRDRDPKKEVWEGAHTDSKMINKLCGIENAYEMVELNAYLLGLLKENVNKQTTFWRYPSLELMQNESSPNYVNLNIENLIAEFCEKNKEKLIVMNEIDDSAHYIFNSSRYFVQLARVKKSKAEIEIMRKACDISSEAFVKTMLSSHPFVNEHLLYSKFDYESRLRGADYLAYIPVIAGGPRATILHYIRNDQIIQNNRLVLMDAGCQYREYASDITRTWPVSGVYNNVQAEIYEACLNVQKYCISECKMGTSINQLYVKMMQQIGKELIQLGIIRKNDVNLDSESLTFATQQKLAKYCPHDVGHYLGLDVHDCGEISKSVAFEPGVVVTIEPGIYIPPNDNSVPQRYRGIGVRIEDDVVVTESGCDVLSKNCPKEISEIEKLLKIKS